MNTKRISVYRVAVNASHRKEIFTTKNLLPSQVAGAIAKARQAYPENYIFVYKVEVNRDQEIEAIIEPEGK
jgi:hypothetical protein